MIHIHTPQRFLSRGSLRPIFACAMFHKYSSPSRYQVRQEPTTDLGIHYRILHYLQRNAYALSTTIQRPSTGYGCPHDSPPEACRTCQKREGVNLRICLQCTKEGKTRALYVPDGGLAETIRQSILGYSLGASRTTIPIWLLFHRLRRDELHRLKRRFHAQGCG